MKEELLREAKELQKASEDVAAVGKGQGLNVTEFAYINTASALYAIAAQMAIANALESQKYT